MKLTLEILFMIGWFGTTSYSFGYLKGKYQNKGNVTSLLASCINGLIWPILVPMKLYLNGRASGVYARLEK